MDESRNWVGTFLSEKLMEIIVLEGPVSWRIPQSVHEISCLGQDIGKQHILSILSYRILSYLKYTKYLIFTKSPLYLL